MATVKGLKEYYKMRKWEKGSTYHLYSLDVECKRTPHPYRASLEKKGPKFKVVGRTKWCSKVDDILLEVGEFVTSLPYDAEYYDPAYRAGYCEEMILHDYLRDRGFENDGHMFESQGYTLKKTNIYGGTSGEVLLMFRGLDYSFYKLQGKKEPKEITISLDLGDYSWVESKCSREIDDIIKTVDSLLKPLL